MKILIKLCIILIVSCWTEVALSLICSVINPKIGDNDSVITVTKCCVFASFFIAFIFLLMMGVQITGKILLLL